MLIECQRFTASCSPKADALVYTNDELVSRTAYRCNPQYGSPFNFDINFHGDKPQMGEVEPLANYLSNRFSNMFNSRVSEAYEQLDSSSKSLSQILATHG